MLDKTLLTHQPNLLLSRGKYSFFENNTCDDIDASIHFSNFPNELKPEDIAPMHKMKSKLFKFIRISIHKPELAYFQDLDIGTRSEINNLVTKNVTVDAENPGNKGQYYCLW